MMVMYEKLVQVYRPEIAVKIRFSCGMKCKYRDLEPPEL